MEYRKLISFGKNSFVVSLPKSWIRQNKLNKGDLIYIDDNGSNLILSKNESSKETVDKIKTIHTDNKSIHLIKREVNSAYILNYRTIILKGDNLRSNIKQLQEVFQNLIALEIMEQSPDTLIAKDFLNMDKVSVVELIKKVDIVARAMFKEACSNFTNENYENINERDLDVNRLYHLLYRSVLYNLDNPLKALKNFKLNSIDLVNNLFSGYFIEGVADEVRRTMRYACLSKMSKKEEKILEDMMTRLYSYYLDSMKAIYNRDMNLALKQFDLKKKFNDELSIMKDRNKKVENYNVVISRIRKLISFIHSLGRLVYQGYNYYDDMPEL